MDECVQEDMYRERGETDRESVDIWMSVTGGHIYIYIYIYIDTYMCSVCVCR